MRCPGTPQKSLRRMRRQGRHWKTRKTQEDARDRKEIARDRKKTAGRHRETQGIE